MTARARPSRSVDAADYQFVPRPLAAMSKSFRDGFEIAPHHHARDQLVYAVTGVMRVRTEAEAWIVPPDRAVYLPAHTVHSISIRGQVEIGVGHDDNRGIAAQGAAGDALEVRSHESSAAPIRVQSKDEIRVLRSDTTEVFPLETRGPAT